MLRDRGGRFQPVDGGVNTVQCLVVGGVEVLPAGAGGDFQEGQLVDGALVAGADGVDFDPERLGDLRGLQRRAWRRRCWYRR